MFEKYESDKTNLWFFLVMLLIALVLFFVFIYNYDPKTAPMFISDEKRLRDSIALLQKDIEASHIRQEKLQHSYDSMLHVEPQIIYQTREKIKFIYSEASPNQLDSIILSKSKRPKRYN